MDKLLHLQRNDLIGQSVKFPKLVQLVGDLFATQQKP